MTCEHLQPLLESERDTGLLCQVAHLLARGHLPPAALQVLRLGRVTALKKPDGGVRGIVVSDVLRRLVARTMAKQCALSAEKATAPFQYALRTRAGCECVSHVLQTLTDLDPSATILSIDGVGAFDLVSRNAMLQGLMGMEGGDRLLPFVRLFHGSPSTFLWEDTMGGVHHILQGEGGEQGDPLMPMLFSLGLHAALVAISERLEDGERLLAFLDDLYVVSTPERTVAVHNILREELWRHAKISVHLGKTHIWNRGGLVPDRCDELEEAARAVDPRARVWRGSHEDRPEDQGITILGTPVGRQEFVEQELAKIIADHSELLTRIPSVQDLQCAWLLLLYCGAARANFYIRTIRPELTANFARSHDDQIWHCFCRLLRIGPDAVAPSAKAATSLPLAAGGLGLRSAFRLREAAHWASWADTMKMVRARHPEVAETILQAIEARDEVPSVQAINQSLESLVDVGFAPPTWEELATEIVHPPNVEDREPNQPRVGWQAQAAREVESSFLENLRMTLSNAEGALLRSQGGPLASAPFVGFPTNRASRVWNHNSSGSCSCADCVSHSLFQPVPADVAVLSTSLAIIGRPALLLGRWDAEGSL